MGRVRRRRSKGITTVFHLRNWRAWLPLTLGKTVGTGLRGKVRSLVLDMFSLKDLSDNQVERAGRQMNA